MGNLYWYTVFALFVLVIVIAVGSAFFHAAQSAFAGSVHAPSGKVQGVLQDVDFMDFTAALEPHITQGYGANTPGLVVNHNGIDIAAPRGTPVRSASTGKVLLTGNQDLRCPGRGYGKFVMVTDSDDGYTLLYGHLSAIEVGTGDEVKRGDTVGKVGMTGFATGPHLHLSVFKTNSMKIVDKGCGPTPEAATINPISYLKLLE